MSYKTTREVLVISHRRIHYPKMDLSSSNQKYTNFATVALMARHMTIVTSANPGLLDRSVGVQIVDIAG